MTNIKINSASGGYLYTEPYGRLKVLSCKPSNTTAGSLFKLGLYAQGAGPLSVKIPVPAFDTTTDLGKVLQVTANGLAWVSLS